MMSVIQTSTPVYYESTLLKTADQRKKIRHGFFTRSDTDGNPLNVSFNKKLPQISLSRTGISREFVKNTLGFSCLIDLHQVHGNTVVVVRGSQSASNGDGLITKRQEVGLMVKAADCQPVLFYAPEKYAVGIAHCGWRGAKAGILQTMVRSFSDEFGVKPDDLFVSIGPSLGPCCADFTNPFDELSQAFYPFIIRDGNKVDFWAASLHFLRNCGVLASHIEIAQICTACHNHTWFSYRRDQPEYQGRFASVIGLV